uniref:O-antigen ligase family protein n=1 Tax=Segatella copri TaxID=165179 RepID=UPI003FF0C090
MSLNSSREKYLSWLLVIPMLVHWALPSGAENRMYFYVGLGFFFIPNICYLIYLINYKQTFLVPRKMLGLKRSIVGVSVLLFIYSALQLVVTADNIDVDVFTKTLFNNFGYIYLPFLFLCYPLDRQQLDSSKWLMFGALTFISFQVILYGAGIAVVGPDVTSELNDYAGIYRVHTTAGASTGSALIVLLLGILLNSFYTLPKKYKIAALILATISVFLSVSRGSILTWCIYLAVLFYNDYYKGASLGRKILLVFFCLAVFYLLDHFHVFDPIIYRNQFKDSTNMMSGREDFNNEVLNIVRNSSYMGVGSGQIFPDKSLMDKIPISHYVGVHNVYLLYLGELGIVGIILLAWQYLCIFKRMCFNNTMVLMLPIILLVNYNTEAVFIWSEFIPLMLIYFMACIHESQKHSQVEIK